MEYLIKTSAVVFIFYTCYKLFLQRDTFFESNRGFLLIGLATAFLIPYLIIPIYVEKVPISLDGYVFENSITSNINEKESISLLQIASISYVLGLIFFFIRLIIQLMSLIQVIIRNTREKVGRYTYIKTTTNVSPFSFFNWIVYNPDLFDKNELEQIITHEKVHASQYHSIDILLTQFACIILWFNPVMWLYNKNLKQNLEFIADQKAQHKSSSKKSYQYTLLKTTVPIHQLALTNNFYNSLIKKRIIMLHKSKSKKANLLKYLLVIPLLTIFLMSFNTKEVYIEPETTQPSENLFFNDTSDIEAMDNITEEKTQKAEIIKKPITAINTSKKQVRADIKMVLITKDYTNADFEKVENKLKKNDITIKFKGIKRNAKGEITAIKIDVKSKNSNANYNISSDESIKPIKISFENDGKNISIGNGHKTKRSNYSYKDKDGNHKIHKSDKGNNVFVISDDDDIKVIIESDDDSNHEEEDIFIIKKQKGKTYKLKSIGKGKHSDKILIKSDNDSEPLFILNGKKVKKVDTEDLNPDTIDNVSVIKGDEGENGVVEITTNTKKGTFNKVRVIGYADSGDGEPLYIINGKETTSKKFKKFNRDKIESINVIKGKKATKKYGDKGANGVIEIITKK